jgi:dipeptidase D
MSAEVRALEPKSLWNHFSDLNEVPRPSKKEERVIQFMKEFGEGLGLDTMVDHIGNVIIRKPATAGLEGRTPIIMQSHLDMVTQKNSDTDFDFDTQGIKMLIDNDWVKADGTTLGADNGIGVAAIMAVLSSDSIAHPPLEALFTIDEETGMTGAMNLKGGVLNGKILLNLDSEDDTEITIGCAGGIDITVNDTYSNTSPLAGVAYQIAVKGLKGGHSGMDIHRGFGNANKLMNRLLWLASSSCRLQLASVEGGSLRNAIPRESFAIVNIPSGHEAAFEQLMKDQTSTILKEHQTTDVNLEISVDRCETPSTVMDYPSQNSILNAIYACPNGIYRMSPDVDGLVQTSNNVARVNIQNGSIEVLCLTRSSVDSEKIDLAQAIQACFTLAGAEVKTAGSYPGWAPMPKAAINGTMTEMYKDVYGADPLISACHAGLECGIIKENYQDVDMISFGPNIRGAHSPDERVQISSVAKFWVLVKATLAGIQ